MKRLIYIFLLATSLLQAQYPSLIRNNTAHVAEASIPETYYTTSGGAFDNFTTDFDLSTITGQEITIVFKGTISNTFGTNDWKSIWGATTYDQTLSYKQSTTEFYLGLGSGAFAPTTWTNDGEEHVFVATGSTSSLIHIYVDGVEIGSGAGSTVTFSAGDFFQPFDNGTATSETPQGEMKHYSIYDRVLSGSRNNVFRN